MTQFQNSKQYDLEERTFQFAKNIAFYVKELPKNISNLGYGKQIVDASGSIGANYIEANESLSKKDFSWLRLIIETNEEKYRQGGQKLLNEALELKKIFSSILIKSE
jgi:hypothetical protein